MLLREIIGDKYIEAAVAASIYFKKDFPPPHDDDESETFFVLTFRSGCDRIEYIGMFI